VLVLQSNTLLHSSAPGGLLKHLSQCELQPMDVRHRAGADLSRKQKGRQGSSPSHSGYTSLTDLNVGPLLPSPHFGLPQPIQNSRHFHPYLNASLEPSFPPSPSPTFDRRLSYDRELREGSSLSWTSSNDSITPSDSASAISRTSSRAGNRRRLRSAARKVSGSDNLAIVPWDHSTCRRFEQYIVRLTASAGFLLSWVENNVWHSFLEEFLPSAPKISRKVLTKQILPEAVKEVQEKVKKHVAGKEVTMQGDGWTGVNNQHLLAFMITCDKKVSDRHPVTISIF